MIPSPPLILTTMELTKEHFDQALQGLVTKDDLQTAVAPLATKEDVREGVEELARITSAGFARSEERFDELETRLDVTVQLKAFERKFQKLEEALHIKL
jgi:hypothetical protein